MSRPTIVRLLPVLDFGGVESRVSLQARMAKERGYDLRVCTFTRAGAAADIIRAEGVPVDVLDIPASTKSVRATGRLIRYIRRIRPSLVHSSIVEANVQLCLAAALTRVPAIVEEVGQPSHSPRARAAFRMLYRVPHKIVAVSKVTARYLKEVDGAPADRVRLIYNCAHPDFFGEDRASVSRPASDTTRFVAIGRLHPIKNQEPLVRGFAKLLEGAAKATLQIVGDGPLKADLINVVSALGIEDSVRFDGFRSDIRAIFAEADAFVLPSLSEGCSISLIESMTCGVPALGSDVAGIREVMGDALADRWTFPVSDVDAIAETLAAFCASSPEERTTHASSLQSRAYEMFSPNVYMAELDDLYGSVLGRSLGTSTTVDE